MGYYADLIKEKQNKDDTQWITTKTGRHIPIEPGETKKEAIEKAFDKNKEKSKQEPSKSKIKGLDVKDQDGKQPEEGMWLFKPMTHNTFRGDIKLNLFKVKVRKKKSGESEAYLSTPNGLVTKGMSHVKGGKLFDSEEEARKYAESQKTSEEKEYDKKTTFEKVRDVLEKQNPKENSMNYYEKIIQEKRNGTTFVNIGSKTFQYQDDSTSSIESAQREMESFYRQEIDRLTDERNRVTREIDSKIRRIGEDKDRSTKKLHQEYKKAYAYERGNSKEEKDNADLVAEESYGKYTIKVFHHGGSRYSYFSYPKGSSMSISYASGNASSEREALDKAKSALDRHNSKEEKDNSVFHYLGKDWVVTESNYKDVRRQIVQAYKDKVADLERKISRSLGTEEHRYKEELRELKGNYRESMEAFDWGYGNSKEKDNDSVEDKFRHKDCLITIVKKSSGRYAFSIAQNGHEEMSDQTYSTQDEAERKAKAEVEEVWSSKEENHYAKLAEEKKQKENFWYKEQTPEEAARILKSLEPIVEVFKKKGMSPSDIAMRLEKEKRVTPEVARQAVQAFY